MSEFDETNSTDVSQKSNEITDYQGDNPAEDLNSLISESLDKIDEDCNTDETNCEELFEQQEYDDAEKTFQKETEPPEEILEQNETNFENLSYEELVKEYRYVCSHNAALGEQYAKYDSQIAEISRNKCYYSSEQEWNNYMDEKISAQNDVSARRYQIQSEMRKLESEIHRLKT